MSCGPCRRFFSLKNHLGAVRIFPLIEQIPSDPVLLPFGKADTCTMTSRARTQNRSAGFLARNQK